MWRCPVCDEITEDDSWEICWHCGASSSLTEVEAQALRAQHYQRHIEPVVTYSLLPRWAFILMGMVAILVAVVGAYCKGALEATFQIKGAEEERGLRLFEQDREFLSKIPTHPNALVSGIYVLEVQFPGEPATLQDLNLAFVGGQFALKPSSELHVDGMEDTLVQNGNVVTWIEEGTGYLTNTEWVGLIDGEQLWGRVYNWGPDDQIMGYWRMYRKPVKQ